MAKKASIIELKNFFKVNSSKFAAEWKELSVEDKEWFRTSLVELLELIRTLLELLEKEEKL